MEPDLLRQCISRSERTFRHTILRAVCLRADSQASTRRASDEDNLMFRRFALLKSASDAAPHEREVAAAGVLAGLVPAKNGLPNGPPGRISHNFAKLRE
jgi:hypothetical protein